MTEVICILYISFKGTAAKVACLSQEVTERLGNVHKKLN